MATKNITSYGLVNPADGNDYFTNAGVAYATGTTTEPTINVGRAIGLGTTASTQSAGMDELLVGDRGRTVFASQLVPGPRQQVGSANLDDAGNSATVANSGGYAGYTDASHGLGAGTILDISDSAGILDGPAKITSADANGFITNQPFITGAGTVTYDVAQGNFGTMTAGQYIIRRLNDMQIHGLASNVLRSGGSDYSIRRSIHKVESAFRHLAVATAIRAGNWDIFTGSWSTAPTATNNSIADITGAAVTNGTADHAATPTAAIPGELVYKQSGAQNAGTGSQGTLLDDYQAKTLT